uniref:MSP domain-containing protein n=1 Tax=Oryza brachyantha TaxID=4533 RepID=J3LR94_ORYBR
MDRLVIPEPTNEVVVRVEPGRPARGELTLRNAMHTMPVAFRLQPAVRGRFAVRPHTGILAPLAAVTVEVAYLAPAAPEGPGGAAGRGEDAFLLHSVVAPGAATGANAKAMTVKNRTAAEVAAAAGKSKVVRMLEKAGGMGRKEIAEKASPALVGKAGSLDRRRRGRKGSSGAIRFGGGKEGFESAAVSVGWSH